MRRDVRMLHEPMRAHVRSLLVGCALAVLTIAGCAVVAYVRPQGALGDAPLVMIKESGALYVRFGDTLHPVLNLASARLIAGGDAKLDVVRESELRKAKRGAPLGIPGAPADLPEPLPADESRWAVCDDANGTTVIAGPTAFDARVPPLQGRRTVLARSRSDSSSYLLYDGRRARVSTADLAVMKALRLDGVDATNVSSAVLNAIPEAPPIERPVIPDAGGPSPLDRIPVGSVVRVGRSDIDELYVVLNNGVQRVGRVAADILRFGDSQGATTIVTVAADAINIARVVESLPVATFPDAVDAPVQEPVVCAQWLPPTGDQTDAHTAVFAGSVVPLSAGQAAVTLAQADGFGPNVDAAFVPPGRCLYVQSVHAYLVADTGVRFAVQDAESAAALGFPPEGFAAPWSILGLLVEGPELGKTAALVAAAPR